MTFLTLSRTFNQPVSQISNQINSIVMALAGAERVFELMDQEPEADNGYVTLVNAEIDENGVIEKVMPKVQPDTNAAEILEYLRQK